MRSATKAAGFLCALASRVVLPPGGGDGGAVGADTGGDGGGLGAELRPGWLTPNEGSGAPGGKLRLSGAL